MTVAQSDTRVSAKTQAPAADVARMLERALQLRGRGESSPFAIYRVAPRPDDETIRPSASGPNVGHAPNAPNGMSPPNLLSPPSAATSQPRRTTPTSTNKNGAPKSP